MKKNNAVRQIQKQDLFPPEMSCLGLLASSSAVNLEKYQTSLHFLQQLGLRLVIEFSPDEKDELPYFAASDEIRLRHLNALIDNPDVQAIYCLRGGFGCAHLLEGIHWDTLRKRRLPVIGYSDVTALHTAMLRKRAGIPVSACMALRIEEDSRSVRFCSRFLRAMNAAIHPEQGVFKIISSLIPLNDHTEDVEGKLVCGNMTVFTSLCGTSYFPSCLDRIIMLEDIGEPVRKLDSYLNQLRLNGIFDTCAGVVFGDFQNCGDEETRMIMLRRFAAKLPVPVYCGVHFGHCKRSLSFVGNETVRLRSGNKIQVRFPVSTQKF